MKNLKQYIPILVFVVTLVLSGVTILTSKELEKRKYIPPQRTEAEGCVDPNDCHWADSIKSGAWVQQPDPNNNNVMTWFSRQEAPDPSAREEQAAPPPPPAAPPPPPPTSIPPPPTNTPTPMVTPSNTPTPTVIFTPTPTATPTVTPTSTLTPTPTITTSPTPTPTGITYSHNVCSNRSCVSQLCTPANQPCNSTCSGEVDCNSRLTCVNFKCVRVIGSGSDDCQSDVSCQGAPVTPQVPKSATTTPTILSIIAGAALLLGGILLAL